MKTLIQNAVIVDGSGADEFPGELLFQDGKIIEVAPKIQCRADEIIDAGGRVACPGFVDMHRHCDAAVFRGSFGGAELAQGITSIVMGNCGMTLVPCRKETRETFYNLLGACVGNVCIEPPVESF